MAAIDAKAPTPYDPRRRHPAVSDGQPERWAKAGFQKDFTG
jgi:hypothetical protein